MLYVLELGNLETSIVVGLSLSLSVSNPEKVKQNIFFLSHEVN